MQAASLSYLGLFFGISVVIGMVFGGWLDKRLHTEPWLRIVGVMLGLATGFNELYRVAKRYQQKLSKEAKREAKDSPPALPQAAEKPPKTDAEGRDQGSADEEKDEAKEAEEEEAQRKKDAWV